MQPFYRLDNPIMPYAWGSHTALATLLGRPSPTKTPEAELWMGAHPKAPSLVCGDPSPGSLADLIATHPDPSLGAPVATAFHGRLPFLFKVLAAEEPLSIQAHPSLAQAQSGFAQENQDGIPLDAPHRNYRDDNHKPELICALTPFWALCGFRPPGQTARLLERCCPSPLAHLIEALRTESTGAPLKAFLEGILSLAPEERETVLETVIGHCLTTREDAAHWRWIPRLAKAYPGDIGALAPLFLNLVCLQPGEGLFLPAGELHAYLEGTGIEIMANSDNVLRGGLTGKHVDLPKLLGVLNFNPFPLEILDAREVQSGMAAFEAHCDEFQLHRLAPQDAGGEITIRAGGPEILLAVEGRMTLASEDAKPALAFDKGDSVFVPAATGTYRLRGAGQAYRAVVPSMAP